MDSNTSTQREKRKKNPVLGLLLLVFGFLALYSGVSGLFDDTQRLLAPAGRISVEVASDDESRTVGLSGRDALDPESGMLFIFEDESTGNCLWMKDMKFSIDMIWMDADKKVVTVSGDVSPDTFPESFCPELPAKYALELTSGRAFDLKITTGEKLRF